MRNRYKQYLIKENFKYPTVLKNYLFLKQLIATIHTLPTQQLIATACLMLLNGYKLFKWMIRSYTDAKFRHCRNVYERAKQSATSEDIKSVKALSKEQELMFPH